MMLLTTIHGQCCPLIPADLSLWHHQGHHYQPESWTFIRFSPISMNISHTMWSSASEFHCTNISFTVSSLSLSHASSFTTFFCFFRWCLGPQAPA
jgi:hypothetical protein